MTRVPTSVHLQRPAARVEFQPDVEIAVLHLRVFDAILLWRANAPNEPRATET
jgi:hypothetical protein